jgi:hypothetical protein
MSSENHIAYLATDDEDDPRPILISFVTATNEQWFNMLVCLQYFDVMPETREQLSLAIAKHQAGEEWSWGLLSETVEQIAYYCEQYFARREGETLHTI